MAGAHSYARSRSRVREQTIGTDWQGEYTKRLASEITELKSEVKDIKRDLSDFRREVRKDINDLRIEGEENINNLRTEVKTDINGLRGEMGELRSEVRNLARHMHILFITMIVGILSLLINSVANILNK